MKLSSFISSILFLLVITIIVSCKNEEEEVFPADYSCSSLPPFVQKLGFNPKRSAFSTSERTQMGLVLKEIGINDTVSRTYQDSSWKKAGWMSSIQLDDRGNIFLAPGAFISVYNNPPDSQNVLYKVEGSTGLMHPYIELPKPEGYQNLRNPFGIMSIAFNCKNNLLYVSSVAGSDAASERGMLFVIDAASGKIIQTISGNDFFGLEIVVQGGKPFLFAGRTRYASVERLSLTDKGKISGHPLRIINLDSVSLSGNNKVRKIVANKDGTCTLYAIAFDYNLIPASEKLGTVYQMVYNEESGKWKLL